MKKRLIGALAALSIVTAPAFAEFPKKDIQGIIQWGAGGSTDIVMRSVTPHAEEKLGVDIVMTNRTGGVGAIATKLVYAKKADGYTLLMGAENPQMYKTLGLANLDYSDFTPINILARGVPVFVASNDAPFNNIKEFSEYAQANPGTVKIGSTGPGGLASIVLSMLDSQVKLDLTTIPYNGDGPALTALQSGAIEVMPAVLGVAIEHVKAGRMKVIGLVDVKANDLLPGIAPITEYFPGFSNYLPWGPFFGVFVKKGTPQETVDKLIDAYHTAAQHPDFTDLMDRRGFTIMNVAGPEAEKYLNTYRSISAWLAHDAGLSKQSPEKFGIPRP